MESRQGARFLPFDWLAAVTARQTAAGHDTPTDHPLYRRMLRHYARWRGTAAKKKEPLTIEGLPALFFAMTTEGPTVARDRALLLLGYAGVSRSSELVALDVEALKFSRRWGSISGSRPRRTILGKGASNFTCRGCRQRSCAPSPQSRRGSTSPARPARSSGRSIRGAGLRPLGSTPATSRGMLRRRCAAAGVEGDFAGHSLRRGSITNAANKKIPIENIKRVTGQRSTAILLDYVAAATLDEEPPLLEIIRS